MRQESIFYNFLHFYYLANKISPPSDFISWSPSQPLSFGFIEQNMVTLFFIGFSKDVITVTQMFQSNQCTAFVVSSLCWEHIGFISYVHLYSQQHLKKFNV